MCSNAARVSGVRTYALPVPAAPLPEASLRQPRALLRGGTPQWAALRTAALARAKQRLASAQVDGVTWRASHPIQSATRQRTPCACWRRLTRWCGTAAALSCSGAGPTHPARQTRARLLRAAPAVARPGDRLGQCVVCRWRIDRRPGLGSSQGPREAAFKRALDDELECMQVFVG
jgi:uncharacterized protein